MAKEIGTRQGGGELGINRTDCLSEPTIGKAQGIAHQRAIDPAETPLCKLKAEPARFSCSACPGYDLGLWTGEKEKNGMTEKWRSGILPLTSSIHMIPARRTLSHPKEWSESVAIICQGWAASSIAAPNGRRQILSFLLSGDLDSVASLVAPVSGRSIETITEVTYRKFKRSDIKTFLFENPILLERIAKTWIEERMQADQLALDLSRRTAGERITRLIINLSERLAKRGLMKDQTMNFPLRQRHIADATGLTTAHVSKLLGEFQRTGLIQIDSRLLTILDATELRRAADWR